VQKSATDDLVYKTHAQPEQAPAAGQCGDEWNRWAEAHVLRGLEEYGRVQTEAIGEALASERQLHRRETEKALAPLQREIAELRGQVSVLLSLVGGAKADVVPLPGARKLSAS